jgi:hypothetical protein
MTKPIERAKQEYKRVDSEIFDMQGVYTKKCHCGKELEAAYDEAIGALVSLKAKIEHISKKGGIK